MPMFSRELTQLTFGSAIIAAALGCGRDPNPVAPTAAPPVVSLAPAAPIPSVPDGTIAAAGDIAMCGPPEVEATARLIDDIPATVLALGDLAYPAGSARDFATCYDPTWGRHRGRTRPAPGNHDYQTANGAPYYDYFGQNAGPAGRGYYSFREGAWLMVSLNSNVPAGADSAQAAWLRSTLSEDSGPCTLAYWHHPLFSSGPNGSSPVMREMWRILQEGGADVVLVSHDHLYERFAPQDAAGRSDPVAGMRQFTVGTGGAYLYAPRAIMPNSEIIGSEHGVLRMTLKANSYDWQFVPIAGKTFRDSGSATCR